MKDDNFRLSTRFLEHHPITSPLTNQKEVCTHGKITQNLTPSPDALCAQPVQLCDPMDCSPPGSSVHGIILTRVLEWVAISSSRGSSQLSDLVGVSSHSYVGRQILYHWLPGKPTWLTVINFSFLPLKTYVVKQNLGRWFLDMSLLSPQVISFLNNKANFPFLPTLLSQVLAFKRCVTEPEFSNSNFIQSRLQVSHQRHGTHMACFVHITEYWITPWDRTRKCRLLSCSSYIICTNIVHIVKPFVSVALHVMILSKPYRLPSCLRDPFPGHHVANTSFLAWTLLLRLCFPQLLGPNLSVSPSFCFISISLPLLFCLNRNINP